MNVLMVIPTFSPKVGGAERQLEGIIPAIVDLGNDVTVVTRILPNTAAFEDSKGYPIRRLPTWGLKLGFHISLAFYLLKHSRQFDIVHCHTLSGPALICALVGLIFRQPVLLKVTRSGPGSQVQRLKNSKLRLMALKFFSARRTRFVAISGDTLAELLEIGVNKEATAVIPNGVDIPKYAKRPGGELVSLVYTGRLIPRKRVDLLLRAFANAPSKDNGALAIIGDGPCRGSLEALTIELGISRLVTFTGELEKKAVDDYLSQADIFVLPSSSEGMSNSLLEAMAHGIAVVARDIAANRELVVSRQSGLLFQDESSLATSLDSLITDSKVRDCLGQGAKESIATRFTFERVARNYFELYRLLTR